MATSMCVGEMFNDLFKELRKGDKDIYLFGSEFDHAHEHLIKKKK